MRRHTSTYALGGHASTNWLGAVLWTQAARAWYVVMAAPRCAFTGEPLSKPDPGAI
jgi:hypothetical protein